LLSNDTLSCIDPSIVRFEVLRLLHISWKTLKVDPSFKAFPRRPPLCTRCKQRSGR
jgi:hypothetical protein